MYLNGFLIDFVRPPTEFVQGCVGVLSVNHDDISTTPRRNHLDREKEKGKSETLDNIIL